jgi:hypothetical protein
MNNDRTSNGLAMNSIRTASSNACGYIKQEPRVEQSLEGEQLCCSHGIFVCSDEYEDFHEQIENSGDEDLKKLEKKLEAVSEILEKMKREKILACRVNFHRTASNSVQESHIIEQFVNSQNNISGTTNRTVIVDYNHGTASNILQETQISEHNNAHENSPNNVIDVDSHRTVDNNETETEDNNGQEDSQIDNNQTISVHTEDLENLIVALVTSCNNGNTDRTASTTAQQDVHRPGTSHSNQLEASNSQRTANRNTRESVNSQADSNEQGESSNNENTVNNGPDEYNFESDAEQPNSTADYVQQLDTGNKH